MSARVRNLILVALSAGGVGLVGALTRTDKAMAQGPHTFQVEVVNTPTVSVGNPASNPALTRDVDDAARQPFHVFLSCLIVTPNSSCSDFADAVPAGKVLVVETITASVRVPSGTVPRLNVFRAEGLVYFHAYLDLAHQGTATGNAYYRSVANVRLYFQGDTAPGLELESLGSLSGALEATVSGYFVDCGSSTACPIS